MSAEQDELILCRRCGLSGPHSSPMECVEAAKEEIDNLRSLLADSQFKADSANGKLLALKRLKGIE